MNRRTFPHTPSHEQGAALGGFCGIQEAGLVVHQLPPPPCFQQFKTAADDEWRRGGASECSLHL